MVDIAAPTFQDGGGGGATSTANDGTFAIEKGQTLTLGGTSTFSQGSGGTFPTTIDGKSGAFGQVIGGGGQVNLAGQFKAFTVGSPANGTRFAIISGGVRNGVFSSLDFGGQPYAWLYPADGFVLVRIPPFNRCARVPAGWFCQPGVNPPPPGLPGPWWRRP